MDRVTATVTTAFEIFGLLLITAAIGLGFASRLGAVAGVGSSGVVLVALSALLSVTWGGAATKPEEPAE